MMVIWCQLKEFSGIFIFSPSDGNVQHHSVISVAQPKQEVKCFVRNRRTKVTLREALN